LEAFAGALDDQLAPELVDRAEDMENQSAGRRGRVDVLLEDHQVDAARAQFVGEGEEVFSDRIARDRRAMTNTSPSRR
jgi:hypothetical protein